MNWQNSNCKKTINSMQETSLKPLLILWGGGVSRNLFKVFDRTQKWWIDFQWHLVFVLKSLTNLLYTGKSPWAQVPFMFQGKVFLLCFSLKKYTPSPVNWRGKGSTLHMCAINICQHFLNTFVSLASG